MNLKTYSIEPFEPSNFKSFFKKRVKFEINEKALKENLFDSGLKGFEDLQKSEVKLNIKKPVLFYPGCGFDALLPLIVLKSLFSYFNEATIVFADTMLPISSVIGYFKQLTGVERIFKKKNMVRFEYEDCKINCLFIESDVVLRYPDINSIDVYLERGFQMFREKNPMFIDKSIEILNKNGLFLTDFGDIMRKDLKHIELPESVLNLGLYKGFKVYRKE